MTSRKIIYGIDLGTTNSAISRYENGKAVIKKNSLQSDTTPSCVAFSKNGTPIVGARAHRQLEKDYAMSFKKEGYKSNTFIEFKRLMGTDHEYECSTLGRQVTPEELSAEVLKELRKNILDDTVTAAVITVPAMFNNTQKDATKRAARMAGFKHVELIQEPVAASIAYGLDTKMKNAHWVVFDFGGGTFDAALMRIEDGVMQSVDTAGNNKLGGKDIDQAILSQIIIPYLKQNYSLDNTLATRYKQFVNMWKAKAEEAKVGLSFYPSVTIETDLGDDYGTDDNGEELALSITITQEQLEEIAAPIYQKAIDITWELLQRNSIDPASLGAIILVGGPTHSPIVRRMLQEQISPNVDTSIDPMTCVATGASIYGSTINLPDSLTDASRDSSKIQLALTYQSSSVETEEWISIVLEKDKCNNFDDDYVNVELARTDGVFTSPSCRIDSTGDVVSVQLAEGKINVFDIRCYNAAGTRLECEPNQINIIQGITGLGDAVIPMALGVGTLNKNNEEVFEPINGLEKSRKLPSSGIISGLKTPMDIRPGVYTDELRITLYQSEDPSPNTRVIYCQRVYDVLINGEDVPKLLPAHSDVTLHLHAERSGTIDKFEIEIPVLNLTIDLTDRMTNSKTTAPSQSFMMNEFINAIHRAKELGNSALENRLNIAQQRYKQADGDRDIIDSSLSDLQSICRQLDKEYATGEWEREEKKLKDIFAELERDNVKYGNNFTATLVNNLRREMEKVIARRDIKLARDLYKQIYDLDFEIARVEFFISWIYQWDREFNTIQWTDKEKARNLIDQGLAIINTNPNVTAIVLRPIISEIYNYLPYTERPNILLRNE